MPDLNEFDSIEQADEGAVLVLAHPISGQPLIDEETGEEVSIRLLGEDSKTYRSQRHKVMSKRLNKRIGARGLRLSSEELEGDSIEVLIKCTVSWKHIKVEGAELECTLLNARLVYTRFIWIQEQAAEFISDRGNYLGNSSLTSSSSQKKSSSTRPRLAKEEAP